MWAPFLLTLGILPGLAPALSHQLRSKMSMRAVRGLAVRGLATKAVQPLVTSSLCSRSGVLTLAFNQEKKYGARPDSLPPRCSPVPGLLAG